MERAKQSYKIDGKVCREKNEEISHVTTEPATDPEFVSEWILPGGALLLPLGAAVSPLATRVSLLLVKDGGGRISFLPFAL